MHTIHCSHSKAENNEEAEEPGTNQCHLSPSEDSMNPGGSWTIVTEKDEYNAEATKAERNHSPLSHDR